MGYTTQFSGQVTLSQPLSQEMADYIRTFSMTRRMLREPSELHRLYNGSYGLNGDYGRGGEFFAKDDGNYGQTKDSSVLDYNKPPQSQPGLWCQWTIGEDNQSILHDDGEKFYKYVEWMKYVIEHFIKPLGISANGQIKWQGKDIDDRGKILVEDNVVTSINLE